MLGVLDNKTGLRTGFGCHSLGVLRELAILRSSNLFLLSEVGKVRQPFIYEGQPLNYERGRVLCTSPVEDV